MRLIGLITAIVAAMASIAPASAAEASNPLLGEWRQAGERHPAQVGFTSILFAPDALVFDGRGVVAVSGYDVAGDAVRVRTATGGSYLFLVKETNIICMAEVDGAIPLQATPRVMPGGRCFERYDAA